MSSLDPFNVPCNQYKSKDIELILNGTKDGDIDRMF